VVGVDLGAANLRVALEDGLLGALAPAAVGFQECGSELSR
jgi:hypothetical protein